MSLLPEARLGDLSAHYVFKTGSAACTRKIIEEAPSSISFTSTRASPTPSVGKVDCDPKTSAGPGSYKQALADAERDGDGRRFWVRQQSWNEQDLKRAMQRGIFGEGGKEEEMQGFSERECAECVKGEGK